MPNSIMPAGFESGGVLSRGRSVKERFMEGLQSGLGPHGLERAVRHAARTVT